MTAFKRARRSLLNVNQLLVDNGPEICYITVMLAHNAPTSINQARPVLRRGLFPLGKPMNFHDFGNDTLLSRAEAAEALTAYGCRTSYLTLNTLACRGGGPPFRKIGVAPAYRWTDCRGWADAKIVARATR